MDEDPSGSQEQLDFSAWVLLQETASPITPDQIEDFNRSCGLLSVDYTPSFLGEPPDNELAGFFGNIRS